MYFANSLWKSNGSLQEHMYETAGLAVYDEWIHKSDMK